MHMLKTWKHCFVSCFPFGFLRTVALVCVLDCYAFWWLNCRFNQGLTCQSKFDTVNICAMVKSRNIGDGHPTCNRNPYHGYPGSPKTIKYMVFPKRLLF